MPVGPSALLPPGAHQVRLFLERPLPPEVAQMPLPRDLERAVPRRQLQFRAGRYCAMKALGSLDRRFEGLRVGRASNGAPQWPAGTTGSITHTDDSVSAAAALTTDAEALGIDTECIVPESRARDLAGLVAQPDEVAIAHAAGMSECEAFTLVFSAKESIFKCLHPMTGQFIDFSDVHIVAVDASAHTFTARIRRAMSQRFPAQTMLYGRFEIEPPWMHTAIALPPGSGEALCDRSAETTTRAPA